MISRFATVSVLAGAALLSASPVHSSHLGYKSTHIILGKAYFYTLNLSALITSLTGRDIKDGTALLAGVKILTSQTACLNPQSHRIDPGTGPKANAVLASDPLTSANLDKTDRTKSTFITTASGELIVNEEDRHDSYCKDAPGSSEWYQLYWQDRNCIKGLPTGNTCYAALAAFDSENQLRYLDPPGAQVSNAGDWTFVLLPSTFAMQAYVNISGAPDPDSYTSWSCSFAPNNEAGAQTPGAPYSIGNPPVNGWGGQPPAEYACTLIDNHVYDNY